MCHSVLQNKPSGTGSFLSNFRFDWPSVLFNYFFKSFCVAVEHSYAFRKIAVETHAVRHWNVSQLHVYSGHFDEFLGEWGVHFSRVSIYL